MLVDTVLQNLETTNQSQQDQNARASQDDLWCSLLLARPPPPLCCSNNLDTWRLKGGEMGILFLGAMCVGEVGDFLPPPPPRLRGSNLPPSFMSRPLSPIFLGVRKGRSKTVMLPSNPLEEEWQAALIYWLGVHPVWVRVCAQRGHLPSCLDPKESKGGGGEIRP